MPGVTPALLVSKSTAVDSVTTWVLRLSRDGHIGSLLTGSVRPTPAESPDLHLGVGRSTVLAVSAVLAPASLVAGVAY